MVSVTTEQILGLMPEVVEVGAGREGSNRHDELPFVCPGPHLEGRKSVRKNELNVPGGLCPFRGPDAPSALTGRLPQAPEQPLPQPSGKAVKPLSTLSHS